MNVLWLSLHKPAIIARGYWDEHVAEWLLKDKGPTHYEGTFDELPKAEGALVIIPARWHTEDLEAINAGISNLPWVFVMLCGDEEGVFPWRELHHPNMKVWIQTPYRSKHEGVDGRFGCWTRPGCEERLFELPSVRRDINWMFSGQLNNRIRQHCYQFMEQRKTERGDGFLFTTKVFGSGLDYVDYLTFLRRSKIALCPSGTFTPDTFRFYEALEAGCIPIIDVGPDPDARYWEYVLGDFDWEFPIVVEDWSGLDRAIDYVLGNYAQYSTQIAKWWATERVRVMTAFNSTLDEVLSESCR